MSVWKTKKKSDFYRWCIFFFTRFETKLDLNVAHFSSPVADFALTIAWDSFTGLHANSGSGLTVFWLTCIVRPPVGFYEWWLSLALTVGLALIVLWWVLLHFSGCALVICNVARDGMHMAPGKISYPSVFVVDSPTRPPPLPPKPGYRQRQNKIQTLLIILVIVALCGMTIEACFIYRMYSTGEQPVSTSQSNFHSASTLSVHLRHIWGFISASWFSFS